MKNTKGRLWEIFGDAVAPYSESFLNQTAKTLCHSSETQNLDEYYSHLEKDETMKVQLLSALNVQYSMFFRNQLVYAYLKKEVMSGMMIRAGAGRRMRIWSAGCSAGEEPYSLAIMSHELKAFLRPEMKVDIFATDIDSKALEKAREGVYPPESMANLPMGLCRTYFENIGETYRFKETYRHMVDFSLYDLLDGKSAHPPAAIYGSFDLVMCCNVLYYYNEEKREKIIEKLIGATRTGGYIVVDEISAEHGFKDRRLNPLGRNLPIYQVKG